MAFDVIASLWRALGSLQSEASAKPAADPKSERVFHATPFATEEGTGSEETRPTPFDGRVVHVRSYKAMSAPASGCAGKGPVRWGPELRGTSYPQMDQSSLETTALRLWRRCLYLTSRPSGCSRPSSLWSI